MQANVVVGPHELYNEPVRGVDYYHSLDIYVRSKLKLFLTLHKPFGLFRIKCFKVHGLGNMAQQVGHQNYSALLLCMFSLRCFVWDHVYMTPMRNLLQRNQKTTTVIRPVCPEFLNNKWINLKTRLRTGV